MLRGIGAILIIGAGLLLRGTIVSKARREERTMREMRDALLAIEREIALTLTPLPALFARGGYGEATDAFFTSVSEGLRAGGTLALCWAASAGELALPQAVKDRVAHFGASLGGDEDAVRRALRAMADELSGVMETRQRERAQRERVTTALCVSASTFLLLMLI